MLDTTSHICQDTSNEGDEEPDATHEQHTGWFQAMPHQRTGQAAYGVELAHRLHSHNGKPRAWRTGTSTPSAFSCCQIPPLSTLSAKFWGASDAPTRLPPSAPCPAPGRPIGHFCAHTRTTLLLAKYMKSLFLRKPLPINQLNRRLATCNPLHGNGAVNGPVRDHVAEWVQ